VIEDPFVAHRSLLFTVAYEMLGSAADAEDVVQESWLRWADVDQSQVRDPRVYLIRVVTRQALNIGQGASCFRKQSEHIALKLDSDNATCAAGQFACQDARTRAQFQDLIVQFNFGSLDHALQNRAVYQKVLSKGFVGAHTVRVQQATQFVNVGQVYGVARFSRLRFNVGQWLAQLSTYSM